MGKYYNFINEDPTSSREFFPELDIHECFVCKSDFFTGEGKLLMSEDKCCNECYNDIGNVYQHYRIISDYQVTDLELLTMKVSEL